MSGGLDALAVVAAVFMGTCWLSLASYLLVSRLVYDVRLGAVRTGPAAWPVRPPEALPAEAAPVATDVELGVLEPRRSPAPRRFPVDPRPAPMAPAPEPALPRKRTLEPVPALPAVELPSHVRPLRRHPQPAFAEVELELEAAG